MPKRTQVDRVKVVPGFQTQETEFLNVDLDILSAVSLSPLVTAFGDRVIVLYLGKEGRGCGAHLELHNAYRKSTDQLLREFAALVERLPPKARQLWDRAKSRDFNIGVQAGFAPRMHETFVSTQSLTAVAAVGGRVVFTVHCPVRDVRRAR